MKQAQAIKSSGASMGRVAQARMPAPQIARAFLPAPMSNHARLRVGNQILQPKLAIGAPKDAYEREADHVAEQVMRMPDSQILQRKCSACDDEDKKPALVQRKATGSMVGTEAPPIVHEVLRSSGHSLDRSVRAFMEPRFGRDFSNVRVHTDAKAADSARAVGALAYTMGRDVVVRGDIDRQVMAHELAHVVQQTSIPQFGIQRKIGFLQRYTSPDEENKNGAAPEDAAKTAEDDTPSAVENTKSATQCPANCRKTAQGAAADVDGHVSPPDCFVWQVGKDKCPKGCGRWQAITGTGCAHWVAHQLGISRGLKCNAGMSIRVPDVVAGKTEHVLATAQVGDVWANDGLSHTGIVRSVATDGKNPPAIISAQVENDSSSRGGVVTDTKTDGRYFT